MVKMGIDKFPNWAYTIAGLQGRVKFPTGGIVRERKHEPVRFRYRPLQSG